MPHEHRSRPRGGARAPGTRRPVPRSRSGFIGRRSERTGTEPVKAQSALGLRLLLSVCFTPLFIAAAALFALWSTRTGQGSSPTPSELASLAGVCAALAVLSAVDLAVVVRRRWRERPPRRTDDL